MAIQSTLQPQFNDDIVRPRNLRPPKVVELYPTAAVLAGDWVEIDYAVTTRGLGSHCKQAVANSTAVCGIAIDAAGASSTTVAIRVQVEGIYSTDGGVTAANANVASAVTIGQPLNVLGTAGRAQLYVVGTPTGVRVGTAASSAASNLAFVDIANPQQL